MFIPAFYHKKEQDSSRRGVRVALQAPDVATAPEVASPEPPPASSMVAETIEPVPETPPARIPRRRKWVRPVAAFAAGILMSTAATYVLLDRPLNLRVRPEGASVTLEWNRSVGFLTRVRGADLRIAGTTTRVSQSQLRQGRMIVAAPSGDFAVSLHVRGGIDGPRWGGATVIRSIAPDQ